MDNWIKKKINGDITIWGIVILFFIISTLTVYSATSSLAYRQMHGNTEYYLIKHFSLLIASIFALWLFHCLDYRYYIGISKLALYISIPLLLFTWRHGANINYASRWIVIPLINKTFQPSDLAQFALIIYISYLLAKHQKNIDKPLVFIKITAWSSIISGLIALTNLSTAILIYFTCILLMFIGRVPMKYIGSFILVGFIAAGLSLGFGQRGKTAVGRITNFVNGTISFQTKHSYIAIATGKLYGKGPGKSIQRNYLPHPYSDFIYSILIEEYGLLGGLLVLLLYLLLMYRGISILQSSKSIFGALMTIGLALQTSIQAMINMSVAVGLLPVTGITLPFISMGGTSLLFTGITLGAIISVSRGEIDLIEKNISNKFKKNDNI